MPIIPKRFRETAPLTHPQPPSTDPKITTLVNTINAERRNLEGAKAVMRAYEASSRNEAVIQQAQNEVRASQATIKFLEDELAKLQMSAAAGSAGHASSGSVGGNGSGDSGFGNFPQAQPSGGRNYVTPPPRGPSSQSSSTAPLSINKPGDRDRPLPPPPTDDAEGATSKPQKNYTQLDLLRYDAPLTGAKITRMLNQLQFKLQVEEQYKLGIEKMAQAYKAEGDRRLRAETEAKRAESDGKIQLLRKAKKRYEALAKFGAVDDDDGR